MTEASPATDGCPAPDWYRWAMAQPAEEGRTLVEGAGVEWMAWGERGRPGLLLLPGNGAHLGWWRHIAPFLAQDRRVVALSWTGMGRSDWRESYTPPLFVVEAMAVAEETGLFEGGPPVMAGHSFGGLLTMVAAALEGQRLASAILVDTRLRVRSVWGAGAPTVNGNRASATREEAVARFRLLPDQPERNRFILDDVADQAVDRVAEGWGWRADPNMRAKTELGSDFSDLISQAKCPLMFIRGALSETVSDDIWAELRSKAPAGTPFVEIPDAHHHVMFDQPIALIATLRSMLACAPE